MTNLTRSPMLEKYCPRILYDIICTRNFANLLYFGAGKSSRSKIRAYFF